LEKLGVISDFDSEVDDGKTEVADYAAHLLELARQCYATESALVESAEVDSRLNGGRWALLAELRSRYAADHGDADFEPPRPLKISRGLDLSSHPHTSTVTITFDNGLPLKVLVGALRALWPQMRKAGYVRPTRKMQEKKLSLVRFVCLEQPPETTWRERMDAWNARCQERGHDDWTYTDVRAFKGDFSKGEASISGASNGLDWFYDTEARELEGIMRAEDIAKLSPGAKKKLNRRLRDMVAGIGREEDAE